MQYFSAPVSFVFHQQGGMIPNHQSSPLADPDHICCPKTKDGKRSR